MPGYQVLLRNIGPNKRDKYNYTASSRMVNTLALFIAAFEFSLTVSSS